MSSNIVNQTPYLRTSRNFPDDNPQALSVEVNRAYLDTAAKINDRTIGIFPTGNPAVTGEQWFLSGGNTKQQTLRQVYQITSTSSFNHGINFANVSFFTVIRGIGFDGTNYYPIPYVSSVAAADSMGIFVTPTQVNITTGGGSPTLSSGIIILEWLSLV
jgi:hypothetical protein